MIIVEYDSKYDLLLSVFEYNGVEAIFAEKVNVINVIKEYAKVGSCYIGIKNGYIVGAGGIAPVWENVGYAWLFLNKEADIKTTLKFIREILNKANYRRIHTHCLDNEKTKNFLEHLGFKYEGRMRKYFGDQDALMYAIVKEG